MTMLDRMRRHKGWLKWSLALVALAMVLFLSPDFLTGTQGVVSRTDAVADVDGARITVGEYQRVLNNRLQQFRASGGNLSEEMLRQLGIDRQVLQSLIDERAIEAEAKRRGIRVSDAEVRAYILRMPAFQDNGQFVGYDRYRAVLRAQRPPLSEEEFEETMRRALLAEKLQEAVTGWLQVSDAEADEEYRRRNEKVKLEAVAFQADQFREGLTATDAEITAHFEKNKDKYRIGERRKVRYLLVDAQSLRNQITPTPLELERFYNANTEQFSNPEQVHASHILLKTAGKDEAAVRKQAESVLAQVKAGGDFAALATKYSEDDVSKARGGDLDFFGRGSMVKPFEDAAFALEPGQISDLVKTNYGFHIIKAVEKRPAGQRPFADVRDQIAEQLKWQQAQERATTLSTELDTKIDDPSDLEAVAKAQGLTVKESSFFQRTDPVGELGPSTQIATEAFSMKVGDVSPAVRVPQGYVIFAVSAREDARAPKVDEVKERVRADVITEKAKEAARAKAVQLAAAVSGGTDFAAAAKAAGREVRTSELIARGGVVPEVGVSPAVDKVAFGLATGASSGPIVTDTGAAVVKVVEKTAVTDAELATARDSLRRELVEAKRGRFFSSYMTKAKEKLDIRRYDDALARVGA
jgi:peptidyl-prolyl cis-trans isomerase D